MTERLSLDSDSPQNLVSYPTQIDQSPENKNYSSSVKTRRSSLVTLSTPISMSCLRCQLPNYTVPGVPRTFLPHPRFPFWLHTLLPTCSYQSSSVITTIPVLPSNHQITSIGHKGHLDLCSKSRHESGVRSFPFRRLPVPSSDSG